MSAVPRRPPGRGGEDTHSGRWTFAVQGRTSAPPEAVWPLVGEVRRWTEWAGVTQAFLQRHGSPHPDGVGARRRIVIGPGASTEEVVRWEPPRHLGYRLLGGGLPVRWYRGDVELRPDPSGAGTEVRWTGSLAPLIPGTGPVLVLFLRAFVARFTRRLCRYGDRLDAGRPPATKSSEQRRRP